MPSFIREDRLEVKIDKISDQIGEINVTLAEQHISLKEHMQRTRLLESRVEPLERGHLKSLGRLEIVSWITGALAAAAAIAEIIRYFKDV